MFFYITRLNYSLHFWLSRHRVIFLLLLLNNSPHVYNQVVKLYTIKAKCPIILTNYIRMHNSIKQYVGTMAHECVRFQIVKKPWEYRAKQ